MNHTHFLHCDGFCVGRSAHRNRLGSPSPRDLGKSGFRKDLSRQSPGKPWGLAAVATVLAILLVPTSANAIPMQQVTIGSNYAFNPSTNGSPTAPTGVSTTGFLDPTTQHAHPHWQGFGVSVEGGGSTSANELRFFLESNAGFTFASAVIADTYTISGPAGVIPITVSLSSSATYEALPLTSGTVYGAANFGLGIGTAMAESGRSLVNVLDFKSFYTGNLFTTAEFNANLSASAVRNVTVGEPFDLAYEFSVTGSGGIRADGMNTGIIEISLPEGYTITSALGYGVPEPTSLSLAGIGLMCLCHRWRTRAKARRRATG